MIRLVLVDDDAMVRTGLRLILGGEAELEVVAEAEDGLAAMAVIAEAKPDVVLMDIRMPRQDGLATTELLIQQDDPPKIIILTTFDADDMVLRALGLGAAGFLLKDTPPATMITAINEVAAGRHVLSPTVTSQVIAAATTHNPRVDLGAVAELDSLTEREREVAVLIAKGCSNAEVAAELYMSVATVKSNVTRIFTKLDTDSRVIVAMKVRDAGLL